MKTFPLSILTTLAAVALAALCPAQGAAPPPPSGKRALAEARTLAEQARGKSGPERSAALEAGARAYAQVAEVHAADVAVAAEACFEAGELWRRRNSLAEADTFYRRALTLDPVRYEARATLEIAHLARRAKKYDEAVELYRKVAALQPAAARGQDAREWIGRTWQAAGRAADAVQAFRAALDSATTPSAAISAANWLAKAQINSGDLAGARTTLAEVETRLANDVQGDAPVAVRLRQALADMTARRSLQRATDKKTKAADDAVEVEENSEGEEGEETGGGKRRGK